MTTDTTPAALERIMERLRVLQRFHVLRAATPEPLIDPGEARMQQTYADMFREAAAVIAALGAELRARDAAPIVGEREAFEAWAADNIDRLIEAHLGVDETTQFGKRIAASFLCAAAWNARAALPSGGGAREAAQEAAEEITSEVRRYTGYWLAGDLDKTIAAIITKHIPGAPAGLTDARRAGIVEVIRWVESRERGESFSATDIKRAFGVSDA